MLTGQCITTGYEKKRVLVDILLEVGEQQLFGSGLGKIMNMKLIIWGDTRRFYV